MDLNNVLRDSKLFLDDGFWKIELRGHQQVLSPLGVNQNSSGISPLNPFWIGPGTGPKGLTKNEALTIVEAILQSHHRHNTILHSSTITVATFVEDRFVPGHVLTRSASGRRYYQSMLKHIVSPEMVGLIFSASRSSSRLKLRSIAGWPYLDDLRLWDVGPDSIQALIDSAISRNYSLETVRHIRDTVRKLFAYATQQMCYTGENPARQIQLPRADRNDARPLTYLEISRLLRAMDSPEKEIALLAVGLGLSMSEVCGLRWMRINLSNTPSTMSSTEVLPPRTLALREERVNENLIDLPGGRQRSYAIPGPIVRVLRRFKLRKGVVSPSDYVFSYRQNAPITLNGPLSFKLRHLGADLGISWLSWQRLCSTHGALLKEFGLTFESQLRKLTYITYRRDSNQVGIGPCDSKDDDGDHE